MDVNPGEFDRLVKFESIASKGNTFGAGGAEVWEETLRVWARVKQATASDRFRSEAGYRTSIVAVLQQGYVLRQDDEELLELANEPSKKSSKPTRESKAKEAEIVL